MSESKELFSVLVKRDYSLTSDGAVRYSALLQLLKGTTSVGSSHWVYSDTPEDLEKKIDDFRKIVKNLQATNRDFLEKLGQSVTEPL